MTAFSAGLLIFWAMVNLTMPASVPSSESDHSTLLFALPEVAGTAIALLLTVRRPENPVGWLLGATMIVLTLLNLGPDYQYHTLYGRDLPAALLAPLELSSHLGWAAGFPILLVAIPIVFPDGRLLSRRWRGVMWATAAVATLGVAAAVFDPAALGDAKHPVHNPLGVPGTHDVLNFVDGPVYTVPLVVLMAASIVSLVIRYRRAGADLRRQLRWFIAGVTLAIVSLLGAFVTLFSPPSLVGLSIGFTALPVGIGIAVLKYRLYEIDVVINRTVLFATMAGFITIVYIAIVVGIGSVVGGSGRASLFLSVLATAIVGVAFQPVFGRARRIANRLVYGKRATPYEVLSDMSAQLAETYAGNDLLPRMARTLADATGALHVEVWLRAGAEIRSAAVWPQDSPPSPPVPVAGQLLPHLGAAVAVPVRHQGELLGALSLAKRMGESLTPMEQKLVADLAGQAGLMLKNVGLAADLQVRLEELRASRQRLVSAQDAERRRIERDLHDGAQQHLVALKIKLGVLKGLTMKDPGRAAELAGQVEIDADEALATLRDLARGIYPPLLADQGLVAALRSQATKASLPVEVTADGVARYPQEIEAAVYFCCLEALQNVAKYARASRATVSLSSVNSSLQFVVQDDGAGFDPGKTVRGSGLTNMTDRIDALGGTLEITSAAGTGTLVSGALPVG
ncbi:MAG TPA: histidine kinase [Candidatus Dormibacteraeota bacterium]|jgi:signal transduction histidine kinase|nr:histidine kinase [Candidatus Dormibacteraeota bacterium]